MPFPASVKGICLFTGTVTSHLLFPSVACRVLPAAWISRSAGPQIFPKLGGDLFAWTWSCCTVPDSKYFSVRVLVFFNVVVDNTSGLGTQLYVAVHIGKHMYRQILQLLSYSKNQRKGNVETRYRCSCRRFLYPEQCANLLKPLMHYMYENAKH